MKTLPNESYLGTLKVICRTPSWATTTGDDLQLTDPFNQEKWNRDRADLEAHRAGLEILRMIALESFMLYDISLQKQLPNPPDGKCIHTRIVSHTRIVADISPDLFSGDLSSGTAPMSVVGNIGTAQARQALDPRKLQFQS